MRSIDDVLIRLRAEFMEMPGLQLTSAQVQRLCGLERTVCHLALASLVDAKFLCVKADGSYARLAEGGAHMDVTPDSSRRMTRSDGYA